MAILEKCEFDTHAPGKAEDFAITSMYIISHSFSKSKLKNAILI